MPPLARRGLSPAETALAAALFGQALEPGRVRIFALPCWRRAFTANGRLIVWPAAQALADFAAPETPVWRTAVLVHELTHVWQAQNGVNLAWAKLRAGDGADAYRYDLAGAQGFSGLNIEQQAMIVQHAYLAARGGPAPFPSSVYSAFLRAWPPAGEGSPYEV